jgi:hypothetical protein
MELVQWRTSVYLYLFMLYLTTISSSDCIASYDGMINENMNWEGCGMKWPWPNLKCCPGICLEVPRDSTEDPRQLSPRRDLNMEPPEYEVGTRPLVLALGICYHNVCYSVQTSVPPPTCSSLLSSVDPITVVTVLGETEIDCSLS